MDWVRGKSTEDDGRANLAFSPDLHVFLKIFGKVRLLTAHLHDLGELLQHSKLLLFDHGGRDGNRVELHELVDELVLELGFSLSGGHLLELLSKLEAELE